MSMSAFNAGSSGVAGGAPELNPGTQGDKYAVNKNGEFEVHAYNYNAKYSAHSLKMLRLQDYLHFKSNRVAEEHKPHVARYFQNMRQARGNSFLGTQPLGNFLAGALPAPAQTFLGNAPSTAKPLGFLGNAQPSPGLGGFFPGTLQPQQQLPASGIFAKFVNSSGSAAWSMTTTGAAGSCRASDARHCCSSGYAR